MFKRILPVLIGLTCSTLFAQTPITVTSTNMPVANDTIRYSSVRPQSVDVNLTGPNYVWNYDTLSLTGQGLYEYKAAINTPYAFYFGFGKYGLKIADSIGTAPYKFYEVYNFYKKTTANFLAEGIGFKYNGIPLAAFYSDVDEIYTFPMNYLNHDSTTYAFSVSLGSNISYSQKGYRINDVDGWGLIKTPYDSAYCLRLVSTTYGIDSINYNGFGFSFPNIQRSYKWMVTTEKIPFLEVSGNYTNSNFIPTQARYRDTYKNLTSINELNATNEIVVYPNPASNELNIISKNISTGKVEITDITGKVVMKDKIENGKLKLITTNLETGIYFYTIYTTQNSKLETGKVIIAR